MISPKLLRLILVFMGMYLLTINNSQLYAQASAIDFAFAINGSFSIDRDEFIVQIEGIKAALENPLVFPRDGSVGFTLIQYADTATDIHVPYTIVNDQNINSIISQIDGVTQLGGFTNPGDGIVRAMTELNDKGSSKNKQFICLSTDGIPNEGLEVNIAVDKAKNTGYKLDQFSVMAIEGDFFKESDFKEIYDSLVFGGGTVTVVQNFTDYANKLGATCLAADLELIGIEVNQVIQDWKNSVGLIESKPTVVRVLIQNKGNESIAATARLRGTRNGVELPSSPLTAFNEGRFIALPKTNDRKDLESRRSQIDSTLNFELPASWLNGTIQLEIEGIGGKLDCKERDNTPANCKLKVTFESTDTLEVKFYNIEWKDELTPCIPSNLDKLNEVYRDLLTLYPVNDIARSIGIPICMDTLYNQPTPQQIILELATRRCSDGCTVGCETLYYGNIIESYNNLGGGANVKNAVAFGDRQNGVLRYVESHEIGHLLGRLHPRACNADPPYDDDFPNISTFMDNPGDTIATIGSLNISRINKIIYGYNTQNNSVISPRENFEIMSYCPPAFWISGYTYEGIRNSINARYGNDLEDDRQISAPLTSNNQSLKNCALDSSNAYSLFRGFIFMEEDSVVFAPTNLLFISNPPIIKAGDYTLRLLGMNNEVIDAISFQPDEIFLNNSSQPRVATFLIPVRSNTAIKKAEIILGTQVIGTLEASPSTPQVKVIFPNGGEIIDGSEVTFTWEASDLDGDSLTYIVQFSRDRCNTWETLALDWSDTTLTVPTEFLGQTNEGLIRVCASDGFNVSCDISDSTFSTPNTPPMASIFAPIENRTYVGVTQIIFEGFSFDREDGRMRGNKLKWTSNLDGFLAYGERFNISAFDLTVGTHKIILMATDQAGAIATDTICISIFRLPPPTPSGDSITNFVLIDASNDKIISPLNSGDIINLNELNNPKLSVEAFTNPEQVGSVLLELIGPTKRTSIENEKPYTLFGNDGADFRGQKLIAGNYTLTATPYEGSNATGRVGIPLSILFKVTTDFEITNFTLVNAESNEDIRNLIDRDTIDLSTLNNVALNIRANTNQNQVGSVDFVLRKYYFYGSYIFHKRLENVAPYALFGNNSSGDYNSDRLIQGSYLLQATPYPDKNKQGISGITQSLEFYVQTGSYYSTNSLITEQSNAKLNLYPVPSSGLVNLEFKGSDQNTAQLLITDFYGEIIFDQKLSGEVNQVLDFSPYGQGIFILKLISNEDVITRIISIR